MTMSTTQRDRACGVLLASRRAMSDVPGIRAAFGAAPDADLAQRLRNNADLILAKGAHEWLESIGVEAVFWSRVEF